MTMSLDDDGAHYRDAIHVETVGVPRWLLHFRTDVDSDGLLGADGKARPEHYSVDYDLRRYRNQHVRVTFVNRDGALIAERTIDDSSNKPPLPEKYRRDIIDPMSAFAVIRDRLRGHPAKVGETYTLPVFDDVRRYDIKVAVVDIDRATNIVHLHLDLQPIAGFKDIKPEKGQAEDAPRPVEAFFQNDARMLPVKLEIAIGWLPLVIRYQHLCADIQHCTAAPAKK